MTCCGLLAAGHTNTQIARRLGISEGTVRTHLENIYEPAAGLQPHRRRHPRLPRPGRLALNVHPRVAMRVLRHAQIDVTMNVYTDVSDAKTRQALKRLGRRPGG